MSSKNLTSKTGETVIGLTNRIQVSTTPSEHVLCQKTKDSHLLPLRCSTAKAKVKAKVKINQMVAEFLKKKLQKLLQEAAQSVNVGSTSAFDDDSTWNEVYRKFPMEAREEFQKLNNRKFMYISQLISQIADKKIAYSCEEKSLVTFAGAILKFPWIFLLMGLIFCARRCVDSRH